MGTVTKTIGTSSRDYSTLQTWEDALPANLVTDGNSQIGEIYNDSEFTCTANILTIAGETCDSTHTITLRPATGQGFAGNANVQTNALVYNQSNGVGIRHTANGYLTIISVGASYVTIDGIQGKMVGTANTLIGATGSGHHTFQNLVLDDNGGSNNGTVNISAVSCVLINSLLLTRGTSAGANQPLLSVSQPMAVANVTFACASDSANVNAANLKGGKFGYATSSMKNCAFFGLGTPTTTSQGTTTVTNGATDQSTFGTTGTGGTLTVASSLTSKTYSSQFQGTTLAGADFRAKTGADLVDAGTTDTTDIPAAVDIAGTARPSGSAWDIGCWELVAAAAATDITPLYQLRGFGPASYGLRA